ncbi:S49 family peptidase, partial [Photobacterium leiognathi]
TLITAGKHKADGNPYEALPDAVRDKWQKQLEATRLTFATKAAGYMNIDVQKVLATEAETFEGQAAIDAGFANEIVNGSDAIAVMAEHLNAQGKKIIDMGSSMTIEAPNKEAAVTVTASEATTEPTSDVLAEAATAERSRIMGILSLDEAKGREATANTLANNPNMDVETAKGILATIPVAANQRDEQVLAALGQQHGESLTPDADDHEQNGDEKAVSALVSAYGRKR